MNQRFPSYASADSPEEKRGLSCWTVSAIILIFVCIIVGVAGVLAVRSLPLLLPSAIIETPVPVTPVPTYNPATPPQFGLSGQATCQNTKPPTASPWLQVAIDDAQKYQIDTLAFIWQIWKESKVNIRFWITALIFALFSLSTL